MLLSRCFSKASSPRKWLRVQSFPDLKSLLAQHGPLLADKLNEDMTVTQESFQQGLQHLIKKEQYDTVLEVCGALPSLHRLVIPSHDVSFAAMCAYAGLKKPQKARKLAKFVANMPKGVDDVHTCVSLLLASYCNANKLDSAEALLFSWIRGLLADVSDTQHSAALMQLLGGLDNGRNLNREISPNEVDVKLIGSNIPGMRVWYSMSTMYSRRGAWSQCQSILRYLQFAEDNLPSSQLFVSPLHYYHTISSLSKAQGFASAIALHKEQHQRAATSDGRFSPHPLSLAPLLQVLSLWHEVTHANVMMKFCEEVAHIVTELNNMSDNRFQLIHACPGDAGLDDALAWLPENGQCTEQAREGISWRQETIDNLLGTLFESLGPHRGLNKFSTHIADRLRQDGVIIPERALMAMIEGRSRANNWRGALELYSELNMKLNEKYSSESIVDDRQAKRTMAYHWIADAMLRDGAMDALTEFLVKENI